jgi:hypothetical protein
VILADTSGSAVDQRLTELIRDEGPPAVTEPVLMEVMAGAGADQRQWALPRLLLRFDLLTFDTAADFDAAACIYRRAPWPPFIGSRLAIALPRRTMVKSAKLGAASVAVISDTTIQSSDH